MPAPGDYDEREIGGMIRSGKPKYSEKTCPSAALSTTNPTCCPDANPGPHDQTRIWTRAAAVGSQRLIAWAEARPTTKLYVCTRVGQRLALAPRPLMIYNHEVTVNWINSSMALQPFVGPWPLLQFVIFFTQLVKRLGRLISPLQGRYLHTGQHKHRIKANTDIHAFEWDSHSWSQRSSYRR
jgi:hypothetical protein